MTDAILSYWPAIASVIDKKASEVPPEVKKSLQTLTEQDSVIQKSSAALGSSLLVLAIIRQDTATLLKPFRPTVEAIDEVLGRSTLLNMIETGLKMPKSTLYNSSMKMLFGKDADVVDEVLSSQSEMWAGRIVEYILSI